ncbi:cytochrome P450-dit2 [Apophysomyces ossiformis]|uniref:Cytochrome P450-dit2 n=1 Tax=Apophysomyces ossiformis TaxID=679940 RepID=A0A8H7BPR5_9FUNG|nr:cytochrome P450-dit2 [Apophysomyces ossiformis]
MFRAIEELGDTVDVVDLFKRYALDVIGNAAFGFDFKALSDRNNKWVLIHHRIRNGIADPLFVVMPFIDTKLVHWFPHRTALHDDMTEFLSMIDQMIDTKRSALLEKRHREEDIEMDMLTAMLQSEMAEDDKLSTEAIREVQDKMRKESIRLLGDRPIDVIPTREQVKQMKYISMVVKEASRLHSPVLGLSLRVASEDCYVGNTFVPKGASVSVDMHMLMHNPRIWKDPEQFDPERFAPGGEADQQSSPLCWLPFSSGLRQCSGKNFSLAEQYVLLAMMVRKYTWTLPRDSVHRHCLLKTSADFAIITINDLNIHFKKRY